MAFMRTPSIAPDLPKTFFGLFLAFRSLEGYVWYVREHIFRGEKRDDLGPENRPLAHTLWGNGRLEIPRDRFWEIGRDEPVHMKEICLGFGSGKSLLTGYFQK